MSMDMGEYWGAYTDGERAAGIPQMMHYGTAEEQEEERQAKQADWEAQRVAEEKEAEKKEAEKEEAEKKEAKKIAIRVISHLKLNEQVANSIIKKLLRDNLEAMIRRYAENERLPNLYVEIAKQKNSLPRLITGFLKRLNDAVPTREVLDEVDVFCDDIYRNDDLDIAYERVSKLQKFIYGLVDAQEKSLPGQGKNNHERLPTVEMKNLLSTARLHFNVMDIRYGSADALYTICDTSKNMSDAEKLSNGEVDLPQGKRHIKNWKVLHLMSILQFQGSEPGRKIGAIRGLDKNKKLESFKREVIAIYSGDDMGYGVSEWRQEGRWGGNQKPWEFWY